MICSKQHFYISTVHAVAGGLQAALAGNDYRVCAALTASLRLNNNNILYIPCLPPCPGRQTHWSGDTAPSGAIWPTGQGWDEGTHSFL